MVVAVVVRAFESTQIVLPCEVSGQTTPLLRGGTAATLTGGGALGRGRKGGEGRE